jgi:hypothetical protein
MCLLSRLATTAGARKTKPLADARGGWKRENKKEGRNEERRTEERDTEG